MKKLLVILLLLFPISSYAALTDSIIAYWKLDESSGTAADSVGSNTLTNNGTTGFVAGLINNAIDLGASNTTKWMSSTSNSSISNGNYTLNVWVNVTTVPSGQNMQLLNVGNSTNNLTYTLYYREVGAGTKLRFGRVKDGVAANELEVAKDMGTGTWHMVSMTYDGVNIEGFYDCVSQGTLASSGNGTSGSVNGVTLGASIYDNLQKFSGLIDEPGLWTRALSSTELCQLYNSGAGFQYPFSSAVAKKITRPLIIF